MSRSFLFHRTFLNDLLTIQLILHPSFIVLVVHKIKPYCILDVMSAIITYPTIQLNLDFVPPTSKIFYESFLSKSIKIIIPFDYDCWAISKPEVTSIFNDIHSLYPYLISIIIH